MLTFGERAITMRHNMRPGRLVKESSTFLRYLFITRTKQALLKTTQGVITCQRSFNSKHLLFATLQ